MIKQKIYKSKDLNVWHLIFFPEYESYHALKYISNCILKTKFKYMTYQELLDWVHDCNNLGGVKNEKKQTERTNRRSK